MKIYISGDERRENPIIVYIYIFFPKQQSALCCHSKTTITMYLLPSLFISALAAFPLASSFAVDLSKRDAAVSVTLSSVQGTTVKAVIKNEAAEQLSLLKAGSFLDAAPVYKATVFKDG